MSAAGGSSSFYAERRRSLDGLQGVRESGTPRCGKAVLESAPSANDAAHLAWLREALGARFVRGVVLHTGPKTFALGERIVAAPISVLWGRG
ncbi:MAG: hypothetical protein JNM84_10960 [Planctomycetes bacterium]|nr:hypothetical protein [Planctomycetota bacterium]